MKGFVHVLFACFYVLVAYFGVGPILLADGSMKERLLTSLIVLVVFVVLIVIHRALAKKLSK